MTPNEAPESGALLARARRIVDPVDRVQAQAALARVLECDKNGALAALLAERPEAVALLEGGFGSSSYLTDLSARDPARLARLLAADPARSMARIVDAMKAGRQSEAELMRALRLAKQEAALLIGLADLAKAWTTLEATAALTRLADAALSAAAVFALREAAAAGWLELYDQRMPERGCGWIFLAMGKQGAHELNYSSDIDLIVLFDRRRARLTRPDEDVDLFVRLTKRVVRIVSEITPDGYVFRTDLRLRPDPGATPIAIPLEAAFSYYESMGQNWERAAFIKARAAAGDRLAGEEFLAELAPFVWRKNFDFAAIADVHSIKRQIHAFKGHGEIAVLGHDVKLGRGGIREIEFFVQTQQLITGGRNPDLRGRATLPVLDALVAAGWIEASVRDDLSDAYLFLRDVEHRIQMVADRQTHALPSDETEALRIARMMGFATLDEFSAALLQRLTKVQGHYARLFESAPQLSSALGNLVFTGGEDDPDTLETLAQLGFARPKTVTETIRGWHFGRYAATRSTKARERLTELTPALLEALASTDNPDQAFLAFDRLLAGLPAGVQLFAVLVSQPRLLHLLTAILGTAPKLAAAISRRPRVLDALLEPAFFDHLPDEAELAAALERSLRDARSYEETLDRARIFGQEQKFLVGVRILTGALSVAEAGAAYARLAEALIAALMARVSAEFAQAHGEIEGGGVAVVALGKLGGREMTAASDLDLMLLYDADQNAESNGERPLAAPSYYARLTQRLIAALSAPMAQGLLYEVDFRLRPSGSKGPLAVSLRAFEEYHAEEAWTWEHMALTRARVVAGERSFSARVEAAIGVALTRARDPEKLRADVLDMRKRLEREKPAKSVWDLKQALGGLIDVEFITQYLLLRHAEAHPDCLATTTGLALERLTRLGLIEPDAAETLIAAVRLYQGLIQSLRLAIDQDFDPRQAPRGLFDLLLRAGEAPDMKHLEAHLVETQTRVREIFAQIVGGERA
ncbi:MULTISPECIES: bifunctional [glutamine synthetase] adenylyltransferase/[glutamine synthetase]-adenylyl-L-tyrosine phosphorylase [Methylosinus]|uniref:Bifunctional glutamine synthetase adenylyltransferase/adenylyl-removing enzyme n=1 Tax=Methylosinus trichosporium (strain ATCC 35070 / NCIMB 11131 / UNIQEM 75 / OB3b) TaxID=595536 RepID=A0A2D2D0Y7_METT3|nr:MULTISPECIES: bifunctional [glutamine synthetase] adenylyltransferase/[glutamine synthetase]-adenylyl-L-tyrosine phosphorylase [Methylosinus]ATQ68650.1 glutamine-synthetase adenylyltransferase [Methylosinus trichosporium OB3b]OBS53186.1 glutamine-synthetase adenylyltransferase [Methylosinus sp. 3S-1]